MEWMDGKPAPVILEIRAVWSRGAPDLDPDPAGSKQSGSGQPDSLPCSSTNHCKHALCFITQCQESVISLNK